MGFAVLYTCGRDAGIIEPGSTRTGLSPGVGCRRLQPVCAPSGRLERPHTAPEADALSAELRGQSYATLSPFVWPTSLRRYHR